MMNKNKISVNLPIKSQNIYIGNDLYDLFLETTKKKKYSNYFLLVDTNIYSLCRDFIEKIKTDFEVDGEFQVKPTEESKSISTIMQLTGKLAGAGLNRNSCLIGVGGGIVGDLMGTMASYYMRGIDSIFIPTTLMSQGDTIINKVALSHEEYKNIIGSFYSPALTFCDLNFLSTLEKQEISLGLSEIIKHSLISSANFFNFLDQIIEQDLRNWEKYPWGKIIYESIKIKKGIVEKDPWDMKGIHKGLSYGHTFANVIEGLSKYKIRHGEAISLGMMLSADVSYQMGILDKKDFIRQESILKRAGLPIKLNLKLKRENFLMMLKRDKLSTGDGVISLVILERIGKFRVERNMDINILLSSFERILGNESF